MSPGAKVGHDVAVGRALVDSSTGNGSHVPGTAIQPGLKDLRGGVTYVDSRQVVGVGGQSLAFYGSIGQYVSACPPCQHVRTLCYPRDLAPVAHHNLSVGPRPGRERGEALSIAKVLGMDDGRRSVAGGNALPPEIGRRRAVAA